MAKTKDKKPAGKKASRETTAGGRIARAAGEPEKKLGRPSKGEQKVSEEDLAALRGPRRGGQGEARGGAEGDGRP